MSTSPPRNARPGVAFLAWIGGGVAAIAVLYGLIVLLVLVAAGSRDLSGGNSETVEATPWALPDPVCGEPCLTVADARTLEAGADTLALIGSPSRTSGIADLGLDWDVESPLFGDFYLADGDPQACVFATTTAPLAPQTQSTGWTKNPILDLGSATGPDVTMTQVARVYLQNLDAQRYPTMIRSVLARCPEFTIEAEDVPMTVTVAPSNLDPGVPGVESVAWTEVWPDHTATVVDLRYGTIVIRTEVTRPAGSTVTDHQIADLVDDTARRLARLG